MNCPVCGTEQHASFLDTPEATLVRCRECGLIRREALKVPEEVYESSYFQGNQRYLERWDELVAGFRGLIDKVRQFQPRGTLLDVGCSIGGLLCAAREKGFEVQGVEFSAWAANFARREQNLPVRTGTLQQAAFSPESFDVVIFNHVLEHLADPLAELAEARRLLKPHGLLVIGVPNIGSFMARLKGAAWASLLVREHRLFFDPATLKYLLKRASFEVAEIECRENHLVQGWRWQDVIRRGINAVATMTGHGEAMLAFARSTAASILSSPKKGLATEHASTNGGQDGLRNPAPGMECMICHSPFREFKPLNDGFQAGYCPTCDVFSTIFQDPRGSASAHQEYVDELYTFESRLETYFDRRREFEQRYDSIIARLRRFLPRKPDLRVLEIGSNIGFFIKQCRKRGFRVSSVEIQPDLAEFQKRFLGIDAVTSLEAVLPGEFDLIVFMDVLEHIHDPIGMLKAVRPRLAPSGIVFVQSPNPKSWAAALAGPGWTWWAAPDHVHHFTPSALRKIGQMAELNLVDARFVSPVLDDLACVPGLGRCLRPLFHLNRLVPLNRFVPWRHGSLQQVLLQRPENPSIS